MVKLKIDGIHPTADGEYDFEPSTFTNGEWNTVKKLSGVLPADADKGLVGGDTGLVVAFAHIVLERNNIRLPIDVLWNAAAGKITFTVEQEADARPPDSPISDGQENEPVVPEDENEKPGFSGTGGNNGGGDLPLTTPVSTGLPG